MAETESSEDTADKDIIEIDAKVALAAVVGITKVEVINMKN
jgi:hypothetical protein